MADPIKIHAADKTDEEVRARHEQIEARLEKLGERRVASTLASGGFPTEWSSIVHAWLAGHKVKDQLSPPAPVGDPEPPPAPPPEEPPPPPPPSPAPPEPSVRKGIRHGHYPRR